MDYMTVIKSDKGSTFTFHGVGIPDERHKWVDLSGFRDRGEFVMQTPFKYGDFLVTGMQAGTSDSLKYIGYVVQIRKGIGAFGSNLVIIRHPDGELTQHANQSFWTLCEEDAEIVRNHSNMDPFNKNDDGTHQVYTLNGEFPETGFIIDKAEGKDNAK